MDYKLGVNPCPQCQESGGDSSGDNFHWYGEEKGGHCWACGFTVHSQEFLEEMKESGGFKSVTISNIDRNKFEEKKKFGGHGSKSVFVAQYYIRLTFEEAAAINCHMGPDGKDFSCMDVYRESPLAFFLHTADMASTVFDKPDYIEEYKESAS